MAEYKFVNLPSGVIGVLPCGEKHWYPNEEAYRKAYRAEEDEIVDELARLEDLRAAEYPEDYTFLVA